MFPLPVILVNCAEPNRSAIRRELNNQLVRIQTEARDVAATLQRAAAGKDEAALYVMYVRGGEDLQQLERLSHAHPNCPILALRDRDSDKSLFLGALRAGAAFAIPLPLDPEDLRTALTWIGQQFGYVPRETTVIAVAGVSGGCGATTLALNIAYEYGALLGRHALLVELALRFGVLSSYLNVQPRMSVMDLMRDLDNLDIDFFKQALTPINEHLDMLCGPQQAIVSGAVNTTDVARLVHYARPLADAIVLDIPATYDDLYFDAIAAADKVVLVWEQKIPSVRSLQMVRDALHRRKVETKDQILVLNRYEERVKGFSVAELQELLHVREIHTVANDFASFSVALNHGQALRQEAPRSRALPDIGTLVMHLAGKRDDRAGKQTVMGSRPTMFGRVVRAFGLQD